MVTRLLAFLILLSTVSAHRPPSEKWISLFNAKDLSHWQPKIAGLAPGHDPLNTFRVANGILAVRYDKYDSFRNRFGALYYERKLKNYRLRVEYRFIGEPCPGGPSWGFRDSGIQYQSQDPATVGRDQAFPVCLEYNLHGGNGKDERPVGEICANGMTVEIDGKQNMSYCSPPAVKRTFHGDQWVVLEIDIRDGVCRHFVNGEEILAFANPRLDASNDLARPLIKDNNNIVADGFVSLQSNGAPIDFRKIELLEYN